jgi:hypothetical protein
MVVIQDGLYNHLLELVPTCSAPTKAKSSVSEPSGQMGCYTTESLIPPVSASFVPVECLCGGNLITWNPRAKRSELASVIHFRFRVFRFPVLVTSHAEMLYLFRSTRGNRATRNNWIALFRHHGSTRCGTVISLRRVNSLPFA